MAQVAIEELGQLSCTSTTRFASAWKHLSRSTVREINFPGSRYGSPASAAIALAAAADGVLARVGAGGAVIVVFVVVVARRVVLLLVDRGRI